MTDNETRARCRAVLHLSWSNKGGPWDCVLPENHAGMHEDSDGDEWDITYRDQEGVSLQSIPFVMNTRPVQDQVTDLATRIGLLESTWKIGGETLKEWVERNILGLMEQIRVHEHQPGAVLIDPAELGSLLKDREELHALRNAAQADVVTADDPLARCEWVCPTERRRCVLGVSPATGTHCGNHLT